MISPGGHLRARWVLAWVLLLGALGSALAMARSPRDPSPHVDLLRAWASTNQHFNPGEPLAGRSQRMIVDRLRALGHDAAAEAFAELDAVEEIWERRLWVAPEIHTPNPYLGGPR